MSRLLSLVAILSAVALTLSAAASAAPTGSLRLRALPDSNGGVVTSTTGRFAVTQADPTSVRVYDEQRNSNRLEAIPPDCTLQSAGRRYALLICAGSQGAAGRLVMLDLINARLRGTMVPADLQRTASGGQAGDEWLRLYVARQGSDGMAYAQELLTNWHTGETIDEFKRPIGARRVISLDRPAGNEPLCAPLKRARNRDQTYLARYAYAQLSEGWLLQDTGNGFSVRRCGSSRDGLQVLSRDASARAISNGRLATGKGRVVRVRTLASGLTRGAQLGPDTTIQSVALTMSHVYITLRPTAVGGPNRVLRAVH